MKKITSSASTSPTWHPYFDQVYQLAYDAGYDLTLNGYKPTLTAKPNYDAPMPKITVDVNLNYQGNSDVIAFSPKMSFPELSESGFNYVIGQQWTRAAKLCDYLYDHLLVLSMWED